ncbi:MAG TPA: hypothetical protein VF183_06105 [Acidimicrobiales bacterium]
MRRRGRRWALIAALVGTTIALIVFAGACGGGSSDAETPADVLADGGSIARVTIGARTFDFVVDCYDVGAGAVVVVGEGKEPRRHSPEGELPERDTRIFVQAFLRDSYVGVSVLEDEDAGTPAELYEASLDGPLDLILEDDVIEADAISFVRGIDLEQGGGGEPAGDGTLRVTCGRYELGDPPGADR